MVLKNKMEALRAYVDKLPIDSLIKQQLHAFTTKMESELREELDLGELPNHTVGVSFDDSIELTRVPAVEIVKTGLYVSCDDTTHVEVLKQDLPSGGLEIQVYDEVEPAKQFGYISTALFLRLFRKKSPVAYFGTSK